MVDNSRTWEYLILYIKAKRADFVPFFVCVLLGDGSGGVFLLVSSRSVSW
jgi:hypothetical protein